MAIDLNQIPEGYKVEIASTETSEERASRLRREEAEAAHQRWKSTGLFVVGLVCALTVGGLCLWAALDQSFPADTRTWASSLVTSMITGIVGYLWGKQSN